MEKLIFAKMMSYFADSRSFVRVRALTFCD